ncbi:hypothetical protein [Pseudovibrio sp. Tun.PSC04-5.I4]|uniref:COG3904 family protein n=1 Tax=Pseudovibrio sp. Tun.PSC04-5.I4 TaxID=1798213 RepID=UPI000891E29F|nr:hypothetical protein [Pseudovibrio sp. Tun.PSC04-5.I4]SDR33851.1 hypothetical protein SAMN04515695_4665 [Pseudovibrio sp. Tun.PSC04-5.I4]
MKLVKKYLRTSVLASISCLLLLFSTLVANAKIEITPISISESKIALMLSGSFERNDDIGQLRSVVQTLNVDTIIFNSPGGNITKALEYGTLIRSLQMNTIQLRSFECASACSLAFIGGVSRYAEPGSIGVHQSSYSRNVDIDSQTAVASVQVLTSQIIIYLIEMGVDPELLKLSLAIAADDIRYLTKKEMAAFNITTVGSEPRSSLPVLSLPITPIASAPQRSPKGEELAWAFMQNLFDKWSSENTSALRFVRGAYSNNVNYYGTVRTANDVFDEKAHFTDRWPIRIYSPRYGSQTITCAANCEISTIMDWYAYSPSRKKHASGAASVQFTWNPQTGLISSENSTVLKRDRKATKPVSVIEQWHEENGACRGGIGDEPATEAACIRREILEDKLSLIDWCYGKKNEYGYQHQWHKCTYQSYR